MLTKRLLVEKERLAVWKDPAEDCSQTITASLLKYMAKTSWDPTLEVLAVSEKANEWCLVQLLCRPEVSALRLFCATTEPKVTDREKAEYGFSFVLTSLIG